MNAVDMHSVNDTGPTVTVQISSLLPADSPRLAGVDAAHARTLAEVEETLPPIIVHRPTMRVIDGMHRLHAAVLRHKETVSVRYFDGSEGAAFLLAVKSNIAHGLPLSLADRELAASRIIRSHPEWSDRAIAATTGLAATTVGAVRRRSTVHLTQSDARVGQDGRVRPINGAEGRRRASAIVSARPGASIRAIAKEAGVSLGTAQDVRERVRRGEDPVLPAQRSGENGTVSATVRGNSRYHGQMSWSSIRKSLRKDPALRYSDAGRALLYWFDTHVIDSEDWRAHVDAIPPHWADALADLSRLCAEKWLRLSHDIEERRRGRE